MMFEELSTLFRHFVVYGIGNWLKPLLSFITLPITTRYLEPKEFGAYAIIVPTAEIVGHILGSRLDAAVTRLYFHRSTPEAGRRLISTSIYFVAVFGLLAVAACVLAAPLFEAALFGRDVEATVRDTGFTPDQLVSLFRVTFVTLFFQLLGQVPLAYVKILKKSLYFSGTSAMALGFGLALNVFFLVGLRMGLWGLVWSALLVEVFRTAAGLYFAIPKLKPEFDRSDLKDCVRYGAALVPGSIAVFALTWADRYFIKAFYGSAPVGVYMIAYKFGLLISYAVTSPFMEIWRVRFFEIQNRGQGDRAFKNVLTYYSYVLVFAALLLSATIFDVIKVATGGREYWSAASLVPVLALGYVFAGWRYHFELGFFLALRPQYSSYVTIAAAVVNQILNFFLIRAFAAQGAAWATTLSFLFMTVLAGILSFRFHPVRYEWGRIGKLLLIALALFVLAMSIDIASSAVSFFVRLLIAGAFPFVLLAVGFYRKDELRKMREVLAAFVRKAA
jgi:O-antigen/teichoic acid export membrane protein